MSYLLLPLLLTAAPDLQRVEWTVGDDTREALVAAPSNAAELAPLVFAFHGHGGTARNAARMFELHSLWPEAIVVYPQGLPTPGRLTDPEGKRNGWQHAAGEQDDRDLKFFDAMLATLRETYRIDTTRIYATGHSNGGGFTYLLWASRPDVLAAVAPSSAAARQIETLKAKPAMHIAGREDALVKFEWQQRAMQLVRKVNGCEAEGTAWAANATLYASAQGTPFVSVIYPGGHMFYDQAPPLIVRFFKEHARQPVDP